MRINGQTVENDKIFEVLRTLPTSFPEQERLTKLKTTARPTKVLESAKEGVRLFGKGKYKEAREEFEKSKSIESSMEDLNLVGWQEDCKNIGNCYLQEKEWDKAEEAFNESFKHAKALHSTALMNACHKDMLLLHKMKGDLDSYEQHMRDGLKKATENNNQEEILHCHWALATIEQDRGDEDKARKHYHHVYELHQGKKQADAFWVEQNEVAFSDSAPLATNNIQQCVLLVLYPKDKSSNKTLFAHIDAGTDVNSLDKLIAEKMPPGPYEVRLVGAKGRETNSVSNMHRVVNFLKNMDVDIISADFEDKSRPIAVIFDPKTRELKHGIAAEEHQDRLLRDGKVNLPISGSRPLEVVFDLTESKTNTPERKPIKLERSQVRSLAWYQDLMDDEIASEESRKWGGGDALWGAKFAEGTIAVTRAHQRETDDLFHKSRTKVTSQGKHINKEKLKDVLEKSPKYIGEKATDANKPIIETLEQTSLYTKTTKQKWQPKNWKNAVQEQVTGKPHQSIRNTASDDIEKALTLAHYTTKEFIEKLTSHHLSSNTKGWYKDIASAGEDQGKAVLRIEVDNSKQGIAIRNELRAAGLQSVKARHAHEEDEKGKDKKVHSVRVNIEEIEQLTLQQKQAILQKVEASRATTAKNNVKGV